MDLENLHYSPGKANTFHAHRLDHTPSKLPTFRFVDLKRTLAGASSSLRPKRTEGALATSSSPAAKQGPSALQHQNLITTTSSHSRPSPTEHARDTSTSSTNSITTPSGSSLDDGPSQSSPRTGKPSSERRARRPPASHSSNGIETYAGPPPALSTQHSFPPERTRLMSTSTSEWAAAQQQAYNPNPDRTIVDAKPNNTITPPRVSSRSLDGSSPSTPRIPPIRSFRASATRATLEMNNKSFPRFDAEDEEIEDRDRTLRALEGYADQSNNSSSPERSLIQDDRNGTTQTSEDLFLNLARDDLSRVGGDEDDNQHRRRSRIAIANHHRSLPPVITSYEQPQVQPMPRRGSDLTSSTTSRRDLTLSGQRKPDRSTLPLFSRERNTVSYSRPLSDLTKSRYASASSRSTPSTPQGAAGPEPNFDSQIGNAGRRPSIPDSTNLPARGYPYRQSNLSYAPRTYNSSPLVQRTAEEELPETPRAVEGTESTASTTAPSTVWDELDDLKSRIRKLELTGKLPPTSGAAVQHASGERPRTATTTNTTMSTSPKRGPNPSISPIESSTATATGELHPLLHSALTKSKSMLSPEIYRALEATAQDALAIAGMTGSGAQSGHLSSAQSVIGLSPSTSSDRQVRRKADNLCRSLTELCLALSDQGSSQAQVQVSARPLSRDKEVQSVAAETSRLASGNIDTLTRSKSSPRALSRLEARRSSLLQPSVIASPRYAHTESSILSQTAMAGRRTSLLMRGRRAGTEEPEPPDSERFRAPSRAATEISSRLRSTPREYASHQPLPEIRSPSVVSNLPVRRTFLSSQGGGGLSPSSTMPNLSSRRFLDRSTPDRDTSSVVGRLAEDRGQRQPLNPAFEGGRRTTGRFDSLDPRRTTVQQQQTTAAAVAE